MRTARTFNGLSTQIFLWFWLMLLVILAAVMSMLVSFNVLDTRNRFVWMVGDFLYRITEPALRPIRLSI